MRTGKLFSTNVSFEFESALSQRNSPLIYIKISDSNYRFTEKLKIDLKQICEGYFFYSGTRKQWGFNNLKNNETNVYEYLVNDTFPIKLKTEANIPTNNSNLSSQNLSSRNDFKTTDFKNFTIEFISIPGRPLFFHEMKNGVIEITINSSHWFFQNNDISENEIAKKLILSLVVTQFEFSSKIIDSFFVKLHIMQESLKYHYEHSK